MEFLLTNLFGAVLGLIVGLSYSNIATWVTRTSRQKTARSKLAKAYRFNLDRIIQMLGQLSSAPPEIPNYPFDTDPIKTVLFYGDDLLGTPVEIQSYNSHRYQLDHLNLKLTQLLAASNPERQIKTMQDFLSHLRGEQKAIEDILLKLEEASTLLVNKNEQCDAPKSSG